MKYLSLVLALCLALTVPVFANNSDPNPHIQLYVNPIDANTLNVTLTNLQQQRTRITIESTDHATTYFEETVKKHNGYRRRLNLDGLNDGKYLLVITQGETKLQQVIVLKAEKNILLSGVK